LSDIAVAFWIGGLLAAALLFSAPLDVSPENLALLIHSASTPIDLLDRLRPFQIGAGVILIASIVFGFVLERTHRRVVRWWIVWFVRSAAIIGLIVTGLYGAGDLRDRIKNVESLRDQLQRDLVTIAPSSQSQSDAGTAEADSASAASTYARQLSAEAHTSYRAAGSTFMSWAWIEALLGAFILLVSAYREASWRRKAERATTEPPALPDNEPIEVELIPPAESEDASDEKDSGAASKSKSDDDTMGKRG
jgi:hypothetical protein